jgi:pimeloyl-ACP methyl ester carboxylesterase
MLNLRPLPLLLFVCSGLCAAHAASAQSLTTPQLLPLDSAASLEVKLDAPKPALGYRVIDLDWKDSARNRDVPARLYLPDAGSAPSKVPLVVFSHGLGGSRFGYSYLGKHWASSGIASLHVQHAGSDRGVWTANIFTLFSNLQSAASEGNALARVKDVSFAITKIFADSEHADRLDPTSIAVAGHSYGANTALLIGGATVMRDGKPLLMRDDRVRALIVISAPPFTGEGDMVDILKPISVPTLHVTGTEDVIRVPGYRSDYSDRIAVFDAQSSPLKSLLAFKGATHSIFTDRIDRAGFELNEKVKRATREVSGLFLRKVLRGDARASVDDWANTERALIDRYTAGVSVRGISQGTVQ